MRRHLAQPGVQKASVQGAGGATRGDVQRLADQGVRGASASLPHLGRISQAFGPGHDLSGVRARVGGTGAAATQAMGALAYATRGDRVAFASPPSLRMAAHEAAHLIQQKGGVSLPGGVGRAGDAHERHADAVADRVASGRSAGDLLQQYARPQAKGAQSVQGLSRPGAGRGVQMWKALVKAPWMAGGQWDTTKAGGRVKTMKAKNLTLNMGGAVGAGNNPPNASPPSWTQLWKWSLTHMKGPPGYVRMHMLGDRFGGAGNTAANLAPGTNGMNQRHYNQVEKPLITALNGGGTINSYKITATYQTTNGGLATKAGKTAWKNTLRTIRCTAAYTNAIMGGVKNLKKTVSENKGMTGKANWKGH
uniref:Uncharacterized protein n=1 Tax=Caulobacter sp. (strain K31) TaxID=366602 RepID=B0T4I4_CAUSK